MLGRATPACGSKGALFLEIDNTGSSDVLLFASVKGLADHIEFHKTIQDGSVMKMRHVKQISLPAQKVTLFRPGATFDAQKILKNPYVRGMRFQLDLLFLKKRDRSVSPLLWDLSAPKFGTEYTRRSLCVQDTHLRTKDGLRTWILQQMSNILTWSVTCLHVSGY